MARDIANLFASLPDDLGEEVFTELLRANNVRIERIISKGHTSPVAGWYDQVENEWVIVLRGEAKITFESGDEVHLQTGSHFNIPAHTKHKVTWTSAGTETIWLAVHYA